MDGRTAAVKVLKKEGVDFITCFPNMPLIEAAAIEGIRPIMARTERFAVGIADGFTRASFGQRNGVCVVQNGPGSENAFAGIAQAFSDSVPILCMPGGYARRSLERPNFIAPNSYRSITKWADTIYFADQVSTMMRRAFTYLRTGRPGPVLLEMPVDVATEQFDDDKFTYEPIKGWKASGDPSDIKRVAKALIKARSPIIRAGNGVLYAGAWDELREFAELLQIPVFTTMQGKSAFPENHPLSLGAGGRTRPKAVIHFLEKSDVVFAIGSSLTREMFTTNIPDGKVIIQSTVDEIDIGKDYPVAEAIVGDAKLVLRQLIDEVKREIGTEGKKNEDGVVKEVRAVKEKWIKTWMPKLTSNEVPINPYRVIWDLNKTVDKAKTIVTAESGGPRDQAVPFFETTVPGGYIGWGKTTTLGASLGFAMGAKLANPEKLVVNILGDAGMGMAGFDFETSAREKMPILSIAIHNSIFGGYKSMFPVAAERYNIDRASGDYMGVAAALGFHAERIEQPEEIIPAIERAKKVVSGGQPAFIEVMALVDTDKST